MRGKQQKQAAEFIAFVSRQAGGLPGSAGQCRAKHSERQQQLMAFQLRGKFSPFSLFQKKTPTHTLLLFPFNMRVYMNKCALLLFPANFPAGRKLLFSPSLLPRHAPSEGKEKENFPLFSRGGKITAVRFPLFSFFSVFDYIDIGGKHERE